MKACKRCLLFFILGLRAVNLHEIVVRRVRPSEELLYQEQMHKHHYLGALPKIGETLWYVAILARSMGRSFELFRRRLEVCRTGSLDRLGLSPSV